MTEYHYESLPVIFNLVLFWLMLYPFARVYKYGNRSIRLVRYSHNPDSVIYGILLILFCTFGYIDNDFYHYEYLIQTMSNTGIRIHIEPVYFWIIQLVGGSYLWWRFVVWSGTVVLSLLTFKRLQIASRIGLLIFVLFYITNIAVMRGNLGIAIAFYGFTFFARPISSRAISYILGALLISVSVFFHGTMILTIALFVTMAFRLDKKWIIIGCILFPALYAVAITFLGDFVNVMDTGSDFGDMNLGGKLSSYSKGEKSVVNIYGNLNQVITYLSIYASLFYMTKRIVFKKISVPGYVKALYRYWFCVTFLASLFFGQETSKWIFVRLAVLGYVPMTIVLAYYYTHYPMNKAMRRLMIFALIACLYRFLYTFYKRLLMDGYL